MKKKKTIAIIGMGYVGLPLAVEFAKHQNVIGYDIDYERIQELKIGLDRTNECSSDEIFNVKYLTFSNNLSDISGAEIFIVTVPTPVDASKVPDLNPLIRATQNIASILKKGDIVIYESTVYPGATEDLCVPELENVSKLKFNVDFYVGYSPERINPGDKMHRLQNIKKIVSGSTQFIADEIDVLYRSIITAGTFKAKSIRVAEAAKVIENTQRDVNIALMNELSLIFGLMNIDTLDVLEAASTKWNFLNFRPGLVGGHCIGVDPYYLTYKAQAIGYTPEIILTGRRINDHMGFHIARLTIKLMLAKKFTIPESRVLVLGLTFKENCPDMRNSKVFDIISELKEYNIQPDVYDPWVEGISFYEKYGFYCLSELPSIVRYSAIIIAVAHREFVNLGLAGIKSLGVEDAVIFDVKGILPADEVDGRL